MTVSRVRFTSVRYFQRDYENKIPFDSPSCKTDNRNLLFAKSSLTDLNDVILNQRPDYKVLFKIT